MDSNQAAAPAAPYVDVEALEKKAQRGANWFIWIAGLSLVNTGMFFAGAERSFVLGLAVTRVADAVARVAIERGAAASIRYLAIGFDVLAAGLLAAAAVFARRRVVWVFALGMVLYALDGLLCAVFQDWMSLAFHGLALFYLWSGFAAVRQLRAATAPAPPANPLVR